MSITQRVQEKSIFIVKISAFGLEYSLVTFIHNSISMDVGTFMICSFVLYCC